MVYKKLSIVIPVHNEEATITKLIDAVIAAPLTIAKEIIIIENGSIDRTNAILDQLKSSRDINVFHLPCGIKGKSVAIRKGFEQATGDIIIVQDADIEYDPNDYQSLIEPIIKGKTKVVYGSRRLKVQKQHSHITYFWGGVMLTVIANTLYPGLDITDEATCYKVFDAKLLKSIPLTSQRFEFCPEITAKIAKRKIKIVEVPISYYPRSKSEGKKINWKDGVEAIWTLVKYRFCG